MAKKKSVDASLVEWAEVADYGWSGILLGNGASIAFWDGFRYPSLFERANSADVEAPLADEDVALFEAFETPNFEAILSALATSLLVSEALELEDDEVRGRYSSVRDALISAVHAIHVPWLLVPDESLHAVADELLRYDFVYSTNYDLLVYWSVMSREGESFKDYFWSGTFDLTDTEVWISLRSCSTCTAAFTYSASPTAGHTSG